MYFCGQQRRMRVNLLMTPNFFGKLYRDHPVYGKMEQQLKIYKVFLKTFKLIVYTEDLFAIA
jgi:hypothetical protein